MAFCGKDAAVPDGSGAAMIRLDALAFATKKAEYLLLFLSSRKCGI